MDTKELAAPFQFIGNRILNLTIKNDFVVFNDKSLDSRNLDVDYDINDIREQNEERFGIITLSINSELKQDERTFILHLDIEGCFITPIETDENVFKSMLSINGCTALYSVARATIISISSQVFNSGKVVLPMLNIVALNEKKRAAEAATIKPSEKQS